MSDTLRVSNLESAHLNNCTREQQAEVRAALDMLLQCNPYAIAVVADSHRRLAAEMTTPGNIQTFTAIGVALDVIQLAVH